MKEYEDLSPNEQYLLDASTENLRRLGRNTGKDFTSATGADPKTIKFDTPLKHSDRLQPRLLKQKDIGEEEKGFGGRN